MNETSAQTKAPASVILMDGGEITLPDRVRRADEAKEHLSRHLPQDKRAFELYSEYKELTHGDAVAPGMELRLVINTMWNEGRIRKNGKDFPWIFHADKGFVTPPEEETLKEFYNMPPTHKIHGKGELTMLRPNGGGVWFKLSTDFAKLSLCKRVRGTARHFQSGWVECSLKYPDPDGMTFEGTVMAYNWANDDSPWRVCLRSGIFQQGTWKTSMIYGLCLNLLDIESPAMMRDLVEEHLEEHGLAPSAPDACAEDRPSKRQCM